jgi:hypothetical protein
MKGVFTMNQENQERIIQGREVDKQAFKDVKEKLGLKWILFLQFAYLVNQIINIISKKEANVLFTVLKWVTNLPVLVALLVIWKKKDFKN